MQKGAKNVKPVQKVKLPNPQRIKKAAPVVKVVKAVVKAEVRKDVKEELKKNCYHGQLRCW